MGRPNRVSPPPPPCLLPGKRRGRGRITRVDRLLVVGILCLSLTASWLGGCAVSSQTTHDSLRDLAYEGIYDHPVTLTNGLFEGEPFVSGGASRPRVELAAGPRVSGDLDGDGVAETVVLLTRTSGGTAVNRYVAVVSHAGAHVENIATRHLGDRVQILSLKIRDNQLLVELMSAGPSDPACCPTSKQLKTFRLHGRSLVEVEAFSR